MIPRLCPSFEFSSSTFKPLSFNISPLKKKAILILNKHTDIISCGSILVITTCLLASKIFDCIPKIIPRIGIMVFNFGGIIWLNVQMRDFLKSFRDFSMGIASGDLSGAVETAAKVIVKGVNIFLTCTIFAASVASAIAFPNAYLAIALTLRWLSLTSLGINIASDIRDYFINEKVIKKLEKIENHPKNLQIEKIVICFLEIIKNQQNLFSPSKNWKNERCFAERLIRQLDTFTLETIEENLDKIKKEKHVRVKALKLFYGIKDGIEMNQSMTKANLFLMGLGYFSMGVCRAFPDSLAEMISRWGMSVLYTDELLQRKFFQSALATNLDHNPLHSSV